MKKSLVLLSSGLDSTVSLYLAKKESEVLLALTFDYGQRAAKREVDYSKRLCEKLDIAHKIIDIKWFSDFTNTSLVNEEAAVPVNAQVDIDSSDVSNETAKAVWVPNRNGIFLNIAAGFAEGLGADCIVPGFNAEEAQTFPDNSQDYAQALEKAFEYSTANGIKVWSPTVSWDKTEIVKRAKEFEVDFEALWPCYFADEYWCGQCESCRRLTRAMEANEIDVNEGNF